MKYVIESLKWSNTANFNGTAYWGPNNSGYTTDLNYAGIYTEEQVMNNRDYYDNHRTTKAVPFEVAVASYKKPLNKVAIKSLPLAAAIEKVLIDETIDDKTKLERIEAYVQVEIENAQPKESDYI